MEKYEMMHRWCNADFGNNDGWRNSSSRVSYTSTYFYSYSTVYAMWLDTTPGHKLMVRMDRGCSNTSCEHLQALRGATPSNVKVIETHIASNYYHNSVEFSRKNWKTELPKNLLERTMEFVKAFKDSKTINTLYNIAEIKEKIDDINYLFDERNECKITEVRNKLSKELKKLLNAIRKRITPQQLIDTMLGDGAYDAYDARLAPQRKAERTRKIVAWWNETHNRSHSPLTYKQIKKLSACDSVTLACLPPAQEWESRSYEWTKQHNQKLADYLIGYKCSVEHNGEINVSKVVNRFTFDEYDRWSVYDEPNWFECRRDERYDFAHHATYTKYFSFPLINIKEYKKLANKDQWLKRYYQKCAIVSARHNDLKIWWRITQSSDDSLHNLSETEIAAYNRIQLKFAQYQADEEAKRLAIEAERAREEAEKARLEAERKAKYASYCARGIQGYRELFYDKLDGIHAGSQFGSEFFYGGNVLLRWKNDELIETSKNILITIPQAKRFWKVISTWHNDPSKFSDYTFKTQSGDYNALSYQDDILTAGCHQIAYCEMKRMMDEILNRAA